MRNKCSWFIEVALFFCSAVTGDAFPDPRGRNKRGEVWTCRCDWLSRYLRLYNGRRTVKNSFTKYNIHSICDWGGLLKDKFVIWQYSLVLPRCSCIFIRSKEYTSLIRYNTPGIYSVVRHPRKRKLSSAKHAQFSCITFHFYSNACQLRPSILSKVRISSITNFFVRVRLCSITEFSHTLRRFD